MLRRGGWSIEVLDHVIAGRSDPDRTQPYESLRELGYLQ